MPLRLFVGDRLSTYKVVRVTFPYNSFGRSLHLSMHLTILERVLFFLSATPLCWDVCGGVISCSIPISSQKFINSFEVYSPHLKQEMILQCMALTLQPGPFANNVYLHSPTSMHELNLRASDYVCMEEMQTLHTKFFNDCAPTTANPPS